MLREIRMVMVHRDSIYRLENLIESDDASVGGKSRQAGQGFCREKTGSACRRKTGDHAGFMAAEEAVEAPKAVCKHFFFAMESQAKN